MKIKNECEFKARGLFNAFRASFIMTFKEKQDKNGLFCKCCIKSKAQCCTLYIKENPTLKIVFLIEFLLQINKKIRVFVFQIVQECNVTIYINFESMKFERPRGNQGINNKVQINNQQFLTFRNAQPNQNTGRSVYSQQFDYRSLQKCFKEQQEDVPVYNFRKNLKNIRSTDKYKQIQQQASLGFIENENGENNKLSQQQKNEQLNKKMELLLKNIKKAKKKQSYLQQQIQSIDSVVKLNNKEIQKNKADIQQLQEILEENQSSYESMLFKLEQFNQRAESLNKKLEYAEQELYKEQDSTQSSGQSGSELTKKLQLGIKELQKMRDQYQTKIQSFLSQINLLEQKLANLEELNDQIRSVV